MNLKDAVEFCFDNRPAWKTGKGVPTTRINCGHFLRLLGPATDINELTSKHLNDMSEKLLAEGKAPSTVNRITTALTTVIRELKDSGIEAPDLRFKRQKEGKPRPGYYLEEEIELFLAHAAKLNDLMLLHDSILFAIKTGCRQGELIDLLASDIDIDKRTILFRETKNGEDHWIKMHEDLVPVLERRLRYCAGPFVFGWRDKDQLLRTFKNLKAQLGLKNDGRHWHTLRTTVATWLCERQVPIRTVMGVLNHKTIETTLRYAKATDRSVSAAIDTL
jgi:integrase